MEPIIIRYGESLTLPIDTGDVTATGADLYVGKPGEMYKIQAHTDLDLGVGVFVLGVSDTQIPLDTYYYQINVTDANGYVEKYPTPEDNCSDCDSDFPEFIVREALDLTEVS